MKPQELEDLKHAAAERYHRDPQFHARTRVAANILDLSTLEGWDAKMQAAATIVEALDRTSYQLQPTPAGIWRITYYGYGMTPQYADYDTEAAARADWDQWKQDPHRGAHRLQHITTLEETR